MHKRRGTWRAAVQGALALLTCAVAQAQTSDADLRACLKWPPRERIGIHAEMAPERGPDLGVGNTVLEMDFTAPGTEPQIRVLYNSVNRTTREAVVDYARQYRLPCLADGRDFKHRQVFNFNWTERAQPQFLRSASLQSLLAAMKNLQARPVAFDLDAMGCPFRLTWRLGQPAFANEVIEQGARNAARAPLIEWLGELVMDVKRLDFEYLLNTPITVDVPCGTIKLD
ncbi:5-methylcytosine-specific restriction endonuclease subunit McrB [Pelomonas aquatica]|jgi:hypothetical protein|uniref:Uncharacterized protein n=1 Tax=Pelomonas aquatica TaxID=431058 RepID=A0A9X4R3T9_9BURK|nr:hypothetical protein [Pelomonas aquatica]MCY4755432.1 hypothetical protein [Pelomonas aquatica]MDG0861701.1 hypothetical protein [Pelomonas aquatica]